MTSCNLLDRFDVRENIFSVIKNFPILGKFFFKRLFQVDQEEEEEEDDDDRRKFESGRFLSALSDID